MTTLPTPERIAEIREQLKTLASASVPAERVYEWIETSILAMFRAERLLEEMSLALDAAQASAAMAHEMVGRKSEQYVAERKLNDRITAENTRLREALEQCAAEYRSEPCTVNEGFAHLFGEFGRRAELARTALTKEPA